MMCALYLFSVQASDSIPCDASLVTPYSRCVISFSLE